MTAPDINLAVLQLRALTTCRCDEAWTGRDLHGPDCLLQDYREDVEVLAAALEVDS